ncbi:unnamed protein product [Darwinula stevensoni]|uniref:Uncharacterized protein n=1 Tax=Darwinula stevensoni TaxID=69355 RepID=A0A7R8X908_9CRUS|nr:unnamed protein product [Darwinula stevensoni]CAG0888537.1 unnamed protein product [Darwinula stevensoni]
MHGQEEGQQKSAKHEITQEQKTQFCHKCGDSTKLARLRQLEYFEMEDIRISDRMKICLGGNEELTFIEASKKYQEMHYKNAENRAYSFPAGFLAVPYMERTEVEKFLKCCHMNILTKDDLKTHDAFRLFLESRGIILRRHKGPDQAAKDCYLDVMRTYVAVSTTVEGLPRTVDDLQKHIDKNMQTALTLLTPDQKRILESDRDIDYPENLDIQRVIDSLGKEKVEVLREIKRNTKEIAEFVTEVSLFIQKIFPCYNLHPMQGLNYDLREAKETPRVVFIEPPSGLKSMCQWVSEVVIWIKSSVRNARLFVIITRRVAERKVLVGELERRVGQRVASLNSKGELKGTSRPEFLILYQTQVTGMSFQDVILLDGIEFYCSWSRMVGMARRSLHVISLDQLASGRWEEPFRKGIITSCSLRNLNPCREVYFERLENRPRIELLWLNIREHISTHSINIKAEERKLELVFGPIRSGKTMFLVERLQGKEEQGDKDFFTNEKGNKSRPRNMLVDCSRWRKDKYPESLTLIDLEEMMKRRRQGILIEAFDIHNLLIRHKLDNVYSLTPRVLQQLLMKMLQKEEQIGRRLHVAFDNVPVHPIGPGPVETKGLRAEWEDILDSFLHNATLASLTVAFQPYVYHYTTTFDVQEFKKGFKLSPRQGLLRYVLSHESSYELRVKPGTLNTRPQPSSLVFGQKPILITPPLGVHNHGGLKCIDGRGRGCVAVTAAAYVLSLQHKENLVVLISDEEIQDIFTEALNLMEAGTSGVLSIYHPKDYRGCESSEVMCVGLEDSWVVEGISRAIWKLLIVDGGSHPVVKCRMGLWRDLVRRGFLHSPEPFSPDPDPLPHDDWAALNEKYHFLQSNKGPEVEEDEARDKYLPEGKQGIFAMGTINERWGGGGIWELSTDPATFWINSHYSVSHVFLAHSNRLIHGRGETLHIFRLERKHINEAPYGWDVEFHIPPPFFIKGTSGVVIHSSLFLFGGEKSPREVGRLDLVTGSWENLLPMTNGRKGAVSVMSDPHTISLMGGEDPETKRTLFSCEYFDTRSGRWCTSHLDIPKPVASHAATVYKDHVYISGGWNGKETTKDVWRSRVTAGSPWESIPSLEIARSGHGIVQDSAGELSVIGGRKVFSDQEATQVLQTETLSLEEESWKVGEKLPFRNLWRATEMKGDEEHDSCFFLLGDGTPLKRWTPCFTDIIYISWQMATRTPWTNQSTKNSRLGHHSLKLSL